MRSEGNTPQSGEPTVGFSFTTILQDFLAKDNVTTLDRTPTLHMWLQVIFTCSHDWNRHWRHWALVMPLTSLGMRRRSWKGFREVASRNISALLQLLADVYSCTRVLFWRKFSLNGCTVLYLSEIEWLREHFEATTYNMYVYDGRYSVVSIATVYGLDGPGIESRAGGV